MYINSDGTMPIQAAIEEYVREADKTSGRINTIIALLRDSVRHPDNDKLMQDASAAERKIEMTYRRNRRIAKGKKLPSNAFVPGDIMVMPEICVICYTAHKAGEQCPVCKPTKPKGTENVKNRPQQTTKK